MASFLKNYILILVDLNVSSRFLLLPGSGSTFPEVDPDPKHFLVVYFTMTDEINLPPPRPSLPRRLNLKLFATYILPVFM